LDRSRRRHHTGPGREYAGAGQLPRGNPGDACLPDPSNAAQGSGGRLPVLFRRIDLHRHAYYMLLATHHWQPLINGYSDHIPADFTECMVPISMFPTRESFEILKGYRIRYAVFHLNWYDRRSRPKLLERLQEYRDYLRPLNTAGDVWLFEVMASRRRTRDSPRPAEHLPHVALRLRERDVVDELIVGQAGPLGIHACTRDSPAL